MPMSQSGRGGGSPVGTCCWGLLFRGSGADFAAKRGYLFTGDGEAASRFEQEDGAPEYYPMSPSVGSPVEGGWMGFSCRSL